MSSSWLFSGGCNGIWFVHSSREDWCFGAVTSPKVYHCRTHKTKKWMRKIKNSIAKIKVLGKCRLKVSFSFHIQSMKKMKSFPSHWLRMLRKEAKSSIGSSQKLWIEPILAWSQSITMTILGKKDILSKSMILIKSQKNLRKKWCKRKGKEMLPCLKDSTTSNKQSLSQSPSLTLS